MSTLTTSPSPVASPRSAFHVQHQHQHQHQNRYASSSASSHSTSSTFAHSPRVAPARPSPRAFTTSSPKLRASNAQASTSSASPRQPKEQLVAGHSGKDSKPRFADAGTQYSPEGFPPTAGYKEFKPNIQSPGGTKKRKEADRSLSPHMRTEASTAPAPAASAVQSPPPPEPALRVEPSESRQEEAAQSVTQPTRSEPQPEPQEARSTAVGATKRPRSETGKVKMMPRAYELCNPKDLGVLISNMLMELIRLNDQIPLRDGRLTRFHSRAPPGISVSDYLQRLIQHATLSPPIMLSMVYYIDRLCQLYPNFTINSLTVHRFLITAATVAAKGLSDSFWTNPTYARIGGIPVSELATLELEFLQKVQWKIVPKPEILETYYKRLIRRTDGFEREGSEDDSDSADVSPSGSDERDEDVQMTQDP